MEKKELMKFKVKLGEQLDTLSELTKSMKHEDESSNVGGVGIDMNSVNPDTMANIKIKFEGCDFETIVGILLVIFSPHK